MSQPSGTARPRWWRRGGDGARTVVEAAREHAASGMLELDAALTGLQDSVAAHVDASGPPEGRRRDALDPLVQDWSELSARVDASIGQYLSAVAEHENADLDEPPARAWAERLRSAGDELRGVLLLVQQFRARHGAQLIDASAARRAAEEQVGAATRALEAAQVALADAEADGFIDPSSSRGWDEAWSAAAAAAAALADRRWATAGRGSESAAAAATTVLTDVRALRDRARALREGAASLHTRREALATRHDRLAGVMSQLRRRYTYSSWQRVEHAPEQAGAALREVSDQLAALDRALGARPLDVSLAETLLRQVRAAADQVDDAVRAASDVLARLDAVSADPDGLVDEVQRAVVDTRRFLSGLPADRARRFRGTFDELAARLERLATAAHGRRPDYGQLVAEADSIQRGLQNMVRTVRNG
jgi:hypothetical protein